MWPKAEGQVLPVIALIAAATFWGVLWYPLRLLEAAGISGLWASFIMYGSALLLGLPAARRVRAEFTKQPLVLALIAAGNGWCNTAFILAVLDGTVVRVLLLFYLAPVWAVLLGRFILGERPPPAAMGALAVAMLGALSILWDTSAGMPWPRSAADWLALSSGFAFAFANVMIRKAHDVALAAKTVVSWGGVTALAAMLLIFHAADAPSATAGTYAATVALGLGGVALMTVLVTYGVSRMPVHRSAVILLVEIIAGAASAQWLAGETLSIREWAGGALIMFAAWAASR